MKKIKTEVWVTFAYGGWSLKFSKTFELDFAPFYNMVLLDFTKKYENTIAFENDDYTSTKIHYYARERKFEVDVRNIWKRPVTDETVDFEIARFKATGWKRRDTTNVADLKELMKRNNEKA